MAQRTTNKDLEAIVARLRQFTGIDYSLGYAYGGVRLESDNGSRDVSPRLSKGEMYTWLHAFFDGIQVGQRPRANPRRRTVKRTLSVPDSHLLRIARQTLKMPNAMVGVMGGPNKAEARAIIARLTGKAAKNPRRRLRIVRRVKPRRVRNNPLISETQHLQGIIRRLTKAASYIGRGGWDTDKDRQRADNAIVGIADAVHLAEQLAVQVAQGFHRNPTLAIVGAANPPGRLLGEVVGEVKYHRTVGKHPGYYRHDFKGQSKACIYAMPDGSLRIIGKGR